MSDQRRRSRSRVSSILSFATPPTPPRRSMESPALNVPKLREARSAHNLSPAPAPSPLLPPPPIFNDAGPPARGRPVSYGGPSTRGLSPVQRGRPSTPDSKLAKKRSWLPGSRPQSRRASTAAPPEIAVSPAFVITPNGNKPYDMTALTDARPVGFPNLDRMWLTG